MPKFFNIDPSVEIKHFENDQFSYVKEAPSTSDCCCILFVQQLLREKKIIFISSATRPRVQIPSIVKNIAGCKQALLVKYGHFQN
jgi:hypothetical protein